MAFNGFMMCISAKRNHRRPVRLPSSIKGIYRLSRQRGGLNVWEKSSLEDQVRGLYHDEADLLTKAHAEYHTLCESLDLDMPHWYTERWEAVEEGVEDAWDKVEKARVEWVAVSRKWLKAIDAQPEPPLHRGVSVVVDLPRWRDEDVNGEGDVLNSAWEAMSPLRDERNKEAKEAMEEGRPLPEWAVELPLAWPMSDSTTSAVRESKRLLEAWVPPHDGGVRERLIGKLGYLLKMREKNPRWSYNF